MNKIDIISDSIYGRREFIKKATGVSLLASAVLFELPAIADSQSVVANAVSNIETTSPHATINTRQVFGKIVEGFKENLPKTLYSQAIGIGLVIVGQKILRESTDK